MSFNLHRKLAVVVVVLLVTLACQKSNPARPSIAAPSIEPAQAVSLTLTGLIGTFVGMANELCDGGAKVAIDDLTVSYEVKGKSIEGALLMACASGDCGAGTALGTITACPLPPNPCEAGIPPAVSEESAPACLTGDPSGAGSLRAFATRPAGTSGSWSVMALFEDSGDRSNTVSGTVEDAQDVVRSSPAMDSARFARRARALHR